MLFRSLYLEFGLRGFVSCLRRDLLLLFLRCPSHGQSSVLFKTLRSCPRLESLYYFVRGGALWSFRFFGLLLLIGRGRILKLGIFGWLGDWRGCFFLIGNSYDRREEDILWPPQLGRSINLSLIEGFFPGLSAVRTTYGGDLCP